MRHTDRRKLERKVAKYSTTCSRRPFSAPQRALKPSRYAKLFEELAPRNAAAQAKELINLRGFPFRKPRASDVVATRNGTALSRAGWRP